MSTYRYVVSKDRSPDLILTSGNDRNPRYVVIELKGTEMKLEQGSVEVRVEESCEATDTLDATVIGLTGRPRLPREPLKRAALLIDLVPGPVLRKTLRKLIADEQHEIVELYAKGRAKTAWWREQCALGHAMIYTFKYPMTLLIIALIKQFGVGR